MIWVVEDEAGIVAWVLGRYGLRIGPAMARYLLQQIDRARSGMTDGSVPVIGGEARTGVPQRLLIPVDELLRRQHSGADSP
jgi:hypothetical protein